MSAGFKGISRTPPGGCAGRGRTVRLQWLGGHGRRPRGGPEPVPREGDLGKRPGLGQSGRGRLVEPNVGPRRPASPTAQARGPSDRLGC